MLSRGFSYILNKSNSAIDAILTTTSKIFDAILILLIVIYSNFC
jgi:hypothetical protein